LLTTDGTWKLILRKQVLGLKASLSLSQVQWKIWDSHFRASLMKVKWELKMDHKSGLGKISRWGIEPFVNSILAFIT
jgi:hypothetical protein